MPGKRSSGGLPPGGRSASVEGRSTRLSKRCHGGPPPGGLPERVEQRCLDVSRTRPCNAAAASSLRAACLARRSALCLGCLHCPVNIARECCLRTALQRVLTGTATPCSRFRDEAGPTRFRSLPLHSYPPGACHSHGFGYYGIDVITGSLPRQVVLLHSHPPGACRPHCACTLTSTSPSDNGGRHHQGLSPRVHLCAPAFGQVRAHTPPGEGNQDKAMQETHFLALYSVARLVQPRRHHAQGLRVSSRRVSSSSPSWQASAQSSTSSASYLPGVPFHQLQLHELRPWRRPGDQVRGLRGQCHGRTHYDPRRQSCSPQAHSARTVVR